VSGPTILMFNIPPLAVDQAGELLASLEPTIVTATCENEDDVVEAAAEADAIIGASVGRFLGAEGLVRLPRLALVSLWAGSTDFLDLDAYTAHGVCVAFGADACTEEVADHGMALMLASARKLFPFDRTMRGMHGSFGNHDELIDAARPLARLSTLTVGTIGLGRAGLALAARCQPFGMRVLAHDPFVPPGTGAALGVQLVSFDDVLTGSDFLHLYVPMRAETEHLIDAEAIGRMKRGAYLVNSSARAQVIDEAALVEALASGHLGGAALDNMVMDPEVESPLLAFDNVILTPHIAHVSDQSYAAMQRRVCEDVVRFFTGSWPPLVANPAVRKRVTAYPATPAPDTPPG
jgi:D-3-phosphoglycerate dehydrogenase / 2-oxoglutarate reductase